MSVLKEILENKAKEVEELRSKTSLASLIAEGRRAESTRGFVSALRAPGKPAIIAEIKRCSPSKGEIRPDLTADRTAQSYFENGARAVSVLTDSRYFGGSLADLQAVRRAVPALPLLRKDFIIDPCQVWETRAAGADCLLLIAAALDPAQLEKLFTEALRAGLDLLLEVHDVEELTLALEVLGAHPGGPIRTAIGINNRNLNTFETNIETTKTLVRKLPALLGRFGISREELMIVSESGFSSAAELEALEAAGADAFLIGESLVKNGDPGENLFALTRTKRR